MRTPSQITAGGGQARYFGGSLGLSGDTAIVGARSIEPDVDWLAYVFVRSDGSWSQQATLVPDGLASPAPSVPVAVDGDTALLGTSLYARTGTDWSRETTLVPAGGNSPDLWDISIDIDANTAVVGSPEYEDHDGGVHVFRHSEGSWVHQTTLGPPDSDPVDRFGSAVSLEGNTLVVDSKADETGDGTDGGSVYVFTRSRGTWSQQAILSPDDGDDAPFGTSVSLAGDTVVIGAGGDPDSADRHSGSAYIFERTNGDWRRQAHLVPSDESATDWIGAYGEAVAMGGQAALLSGRWSPTPQIQDGVTSVFLFSSTGDSWSQAGILAPGASGGRLGPVALTDDTALVGSPVDGRDGSGEQGVVYVYQR